MLQACSPDHGNYKPGGNPQALLDAEGPMAIVEDETEIPPDQQHMQARQQVAPDQVAQATDSYTQHFQPADMNEDTRYRVLRLEKRVDGLDRNFKQLLPPLKKLIVPGDDLGPAITDIETREDMAEATPAIAEKITQTDFIKGAPKNIKTNLASDTADLKSIPAPVVASALPQPAVKNNAAPTVKPSSATAGSAILDIRSGEHPGKTRLVLDTSGPVDFKYDIDNNEKLLLIELKGAALSASSAKSFGNSIFLKAYTAKIEGGTIKLAVELKKNAKILSSGTIKPEGGKGNTRIVLDIGAP